MRRILLALTAFAAVAAVAVPLSVQSDEVASTAALPARQLTGYWHNFDNGAAVMKLKDVPKAYDMIEVAFANATSQPGGVDFAVDPGIATKLGGYTDADFIADVKALKAAGKTVVLSIGGEKGNVALTSSGAASTFASTMAGLISKFGFDGVDIDLEGGHNIEVASATSAIKQLKAKVPGLVLTMAPETFYLQANGTYLQLIKNLKSEITVIHPQFYNSGAMNGCDGNVYSQGSVDFITAQACILIQDGGLRPDQVALGLPASARGAGSGYVAPGIITNALDCLDKGTNCGKYKPATPFKGIRGVMTWSINWDVTAGNSFATPIRAHLNGM
ncbi:chitinase [Pseudonocardiaceae bacterium YIM PH 21723]|nr:chitinase [Pseudonocardiaceae bacterium YIM PH 21723]